MCCTIGTWLLEVSSHLFDLWYVEFVEALSLIECNMAKCMWALETEKITQLMSEIQETEPRRWLAAILISPLKHEELDKDGMLVGKQSTRALFRVLYYPLTVL